MRKFLFIILIVILSITGYTAYSLLYPVIKQESQKIPFKIWYQKHPPKTRKQNHTVTNSRIVESPDFYIDTLYRSMEGPYNSTEFYLEDNPLNLFCSVYKPKLAWLTGYRVELYNDKNELVSADFLCHNNLNISIKNTLPWLSKTLGTDTRIFTLTEGQTELKLPHGFGVPVLSNQRLRVDFQVLNHNMLPISLRLKHRIIIEYVWDDDLTEAMTALYQQSVFITKQISGPIGHYNEIPQNPDSVLNTLEQDPKTCCSSPSFNGLYDFDPFQDRYGRKYTGHWIIDDSLETLTTDVTRMLLLTEDARVHFISVHVHPFCESLELLDDSTNQIIYKASTKNFKDKIGLSKISYLSSPEGILLSQNHPYTLRSVYNKTDSARHTAMATMFLYLEE